jgi:diguanylate cyclase (GGDEF)-like protein/PAS domain S-box-containing protein
MTPVIFTRLLTPNSFSTKTVFIASSLFMAGVFAADLFLPADIRLHVLYIFPLAFIALHCEQASMVAGGLVLSFAFQLLTFFMDDMSLGTLATDIVIAFAASALTIVLSRIARQREKALRSSHDTLRSILDTSLDGFWHADTQGNLFDVNPAYCKHSGYTREELLGLKITDLEVAGNAANISGLMQYINERDNGLFEFTHRRKDGSIWHVEASITYHNESRQFYVFLRDITGRKQAEEERRIAAIAFDSHAGMIITDASGNILMVNRSFTQITGYSATEAIGKTPALLKSGRQDREFYQRMWNTLSERGHWQGEMWNKCKNGSIYAELLTITAVTAPDGSITHYVGTFSDITQSKATEAEIHRLAYYDPLTQLPNRRLLQDRLSQALIATARSGLYGSLLFIDLDHFKTLNDTRGHDAGDLLLQHVAQRLVTCVREGDTVARLGGDEFVVMLEGLNKNPLEAATLAETVGEKILAALNQPYMLADYEHSSTPSIGATLFGGEPITSEELLKQADLAMYQSKTAGRNTLSFFDPVMQSSVSERAALEFDLRSAVSHQQFVLYYQPQVIGNGRLTGAEALVRWQHPMRGMVSPADFIPLAEETGLILPLGLWVLETACTQLAKWAHKKNMEHLTLAVNVSASQIQQADFVDQIIAVISRTGANPNRLKLELTESMLVSDVEDIIAKMSILKARGVGFSLDDFGTGYSSLSYLKRLPLDQLKIDQSFVRDILVDSNDAAIAKMVITLSESLGLTVIAEGVEIESQREFLARHGCHAYQGYFFSRPLPIDGFDEFAQRV